MSHGVMGAHPQGLGMVTTYYGPAFAIAPSRFGYFGSSLPADATPAMQADIYAELLDDLGVERAVVVGSPPAVPRPSSSRCAIPNESICWCCVTRSTASIWCDVVDSPKARARPHDRNEPPHRFCQDVFN